QVNAWLIARGRQPVRWEAAPAARNALF
ncbi:uracil-DNA glycosylase, partial [Bacillus sp. AFS015802]